MRTLVVFAVTKGVFTLGIFSAGQNIPSYIYYAYTMSAFIPAHSIALDVRKDLNAKQAMTDK